MIRRPLRVNRTDAPFPDTTLCRSTRRGVPVPRRRCGSVRHRSGSERRRGVPARMTRRVVVINGAGGALGSALSAHFAAEPGTDLVLSDISEASLQATVDALPDADGAVETVLADVSDFDEVEAVVRSEEHTSELQSLMRIS